MLKGKHVGLRAIEPSDLEPLLRWRNRPEFRKFFREHRELSMTQQTQWFQSIQGPDSKARMFAIVALQSSELLGACGLCYLDLINRNADLSIYIGKDGLYIDDQLAPDAAQTLMTYGYDELNLHRIWAEIYDFDSAKIKFFESLGFQREGLHRNTHWSMGKWSNSIFWGMLSEEFRARNPSTIDQR
jgi:RimJ/RimL family protein N-acetyltransferase